MIRNDPAKHFFIWPAVLVVLAVSIFPLIYSLTISFMSFRLMPPLPPRFVGLDNYAALLQLPRFWTVIGTTSLIAGLAVLLLVTFRVLRSHTMLYVSTHMISRPGAAAKHIRLDFLERPTRRAQ